MLKYDLKGALQAYEAKTGMRITYEEVAGLTGISIDTIKSIASRSNYNVTLKMISEISEAINIDPTSHFQWKNLLEK